MLSPNLIEEIRKDVFSSSGVKINKDDPILLNAHVIKALFDHHIQETEQLTDSIVGKNLGKMDETVRKYIAALEKVNQSYIDNTKLFLNSFERTIVELQKKEEKSWEKISKDVANQTKSKLNPVLLCLQIIIILILCYNSII